MKTIRKKAIEELRMSSTEFDRIMGHALQVKPEAASAKKTKKAKTKKAKKQPIKTKEKI
jgi:hypothetical protein